MKKFLPFLMLLLTPAWWGCSESALSPASYVKWIQDPDHGLKQVKQIGEMIFQVQYKPPDYILAMEKREPVIREEERQSRRQELEGMHYFNLHYDIANTSENALQYGATSGAEYQERVQYFSFGLKHDIYLEENGQRVPCELFQFARNYGISPGLDFSLAFPKGEEDSDLQLVIEEKVFNTGKIRFTIDRGNLDNLPTLITH